MNSETGSVFVLSDARSGSTLLDQCLGGHPDLVSLGEVHWLKAYVHQDRATYNPRHPLVCSCGNVLTECPFWKLVESALQRPLDSLQLRARMTENRTSQPWIDRIGRLPGRVVESFPTLYRHRVVRALLGDDRMTADSIALIRAVHKATGCHYCVDSSKSPLRFRAVYDADPANTRAIVLVRDFRAVVHSKMKRGASLEGAATGWCRKMQQIEAITSDLPPGHACILKYESLCKSPRVELERICAFLGIHLAETMLQRPESTTHTIGGSPSKFDPARVRIEADAAFESAFSEDDLHRMRDIVGDVALRWGY